MGVASPLPPLAPETPLARFSADRKAIGSEARAPRRVRDAVMLPRPEPDGRWALSTFRLDGLDEPARQAFGRAWVQKNFPPSRSLKAYCALPAEAFENVPGGPLRAEFDDDPPRHVNVLGWPDDEPRRLAIAQELCALVETRGTIVRY